jgi:hypothetical protein
MDEVEGKECRNCKLFLSKDYYNKKSLSNDGLQYWCIPCLRKRNCKKKLKDGSTNKWFLGEKKCIECFEIKQIGFFEKLGENAPPNLQNIYRSVCNSCLKQNKNKNNKLDILCKSVNLYHNFYKIFFDILDLK